MKSRLILTALLLLSACTAGGLRPTLFTIPPSYLKSFPLGSITEDDLLVRIGPPENRITGPRGLTSIVYSVGSEYGRKTFTYVMKDGFVADVIYNDNGPYNGTRASKTQGLTPP